MQQKNAADYMTYSTMNDNGKKEIIRVIRSSDGELFRLGEWGGYDTLNPFNPIRKFVVHNGMIYLNEYNVERFVR